MRCVEIDPTPVPGRTTIPIMATKDFFALSNRDRMEASAAAGKLRRST